MPTRFGDRQGFSTGSASDCLHRTAGQRPAHPSDVLRTRRARGPRTRVMSCAPGGPEARAPGGCPTHQAGQRPAHPGDVLYGCTDTVLLRPDDLLMRQDMSDRHFIPLYPIGTTKDNSRLSTHQAGQRPAHPGDVLYGCTSTVLLRPLLLFRNIIAKIRKPLSHYHWHHGIMRVGHVRPRFFPLML